MKVTDIIPQRSPFLLLDQVIEVQAGKSAIAQKNVTINEWFLKNNKRLVMPSMLIIEALAQTGAMAILSDDNHRNKNAFFGGIKQADIYTSVTCGDQLTFEVQLTKLKEPVGKGHGIVTNQNHEIILEADLIFVIG